jgi:hypothetical protein
MPRERPALRLKVTRTHALAAADPYSEEQLQRFPPEHELEVKIQPDLSYWKRRRYWQILDLIIERCETPWKTADEAHDVLKIRCGLTQVSIEAGTERILPGSTTGLLDHEFDDYFESAMAWLFETTGVDPETMQTEAGAVSPLEDAVSPLAPSNGDGGGGGSDAVVADEPTMLLHQPMSTAALKQEAISKLLEIATNKRGELPTAEERVAIIRQARPDWEKMLPGHPGFVKHVFETAEKVATGQLPAEAGRKFLFSMRDG